MSSEGVNRTSDRLPRGGRAAAPGHRGERAFTFAEVLAAMVFLAILIPVVVQGLALANKAAVVVERNTVALQLAQNHLSTLLLDDAWQTAEVRGAFLPDYPGYRFELTQGAWLEDDMVQLDLRVLFDVQGQEYQVRVVTLVAEPTL